MSFVRFLNVYLTFGFPVSTDELHLRHVQRIRSLQTRPYPTGTLES